MLKPIPFGFTALIVGGVVLFFMAQSDQTWVYPSWVNFSKRFTGEGNEEKVRSIYAAGYFGATALLINVVSLFVVFLVLVKNTYF